MRKIYLFTILSIVFFLFQAQAQISSPTAITSVSTAYTNGLPNDLIYIFCGAEGTGSLDAIPPSGTGPWSFEWVQFNSTTFSYDPFLIQSNQNTSTISNLNSGGYKVIIRDANNVVQGCFRAWVFCRDLFVDAGNIAAGCGPVTLSGAATGDNTFTYYNPIPDPFLVDANTTVNICFNAVHTFVSDLGFYLVGPPSCGSPTIPLAPHPEFINSAQGCCCNGGEDLTNLCFSTANTNMLQVCGAVTPLSGSFGIYGQGTPDNFNVNNNNWSPIFGCDATLGGWSVQIYDCIGADVGFLTNAVISFTGMSSCGLQTITYNSGTIASAINDNSCDPLSASVYSVPLSTLITTPITYNTSFSFQWTSIPSVSIPNSNTSLNPTIDPGPDFDVMFYLTMTTPEGCIKVDSASYVYLPPGIPVINAVSPKCTNSAPFNLSATPLNGTWSGTGITNANTGAFNPSVAGIGVHTIQYISPMPCGDTNTIDITVFATPIAQFSVPDSTCNNIVPFDGGVSTITGPATITGYTWDFQSNGSSEINNGAAGQNFTYTSPGIYNVTMIAISNNGCMDTIQETVNVMPVPVSSVALSPQPNCQATMQFDASASAVAAPYEITNYSWDFTNNGSVDINSPDSTVSFNYGAPGTYTGSLTTTTGGGCTQTITFPVTILAKPIADFVIADTVCVFNVSANAASSSIPSPGTIQSYSWDFDGDGNFDITNGTVNPTFNYTQSGNYSVTLIVNATNGCKDTAQANISVNSAAITGLQVAPSPICDEPVTFTATVAGSSVLNYQWDFDNNGSIDQTTVTNTLTHDYGGPGTYAATLIVTATGSCKDTITTPIVVHALPQLVLNALNESCNPLNPFSLAQSSIPAPETLASYSWDMDNNGTFETNGMNINYSFQTPGTYTYDFQATSGVGCSTESTATIIINPQPTANFTAPNLCESQNAVFLNQSTFNGGNPTLNYTWNFGDGTSDNQANPIHQYPGMGSYIVQLIVTTDKGCADTIGHPLTVSPDPIANFNAAPECFLVAVYTSQSTAPFSSVDSLYWDFGNGTSSNDSSIIQQYTEAGTYTVTLTVTNAAGCSDSFSSSVIIQPGLSADKMIVPNIITPNGDGVNDDLILDPLFEECETYEIAFFNRWGNKMYTQTHGDLPFPGGKNLTPGVYFYVIKSGTTVVNGTITVK